jgi:hypothetical protein
MKVLFSKRTVEAGLTISYMYILSPLNLVLKDSISLQAFSEQYMDEIKKDKLFESQNNFKVEAFTFEVILK